jgi:hypothetical protein
MIGVFGYFANPCKWVHIGCKSKQNLRNLGKVGCNNFKYLQSLRQSGLRHQLI